MRDEISDSKSILASTMTDHCGERCIFKYLEEGYLGDKESAVKAIKRKELLCSTDNLENPGN
jgi:hypothetical protein